MTPAANEAVKPLRIPPSSGYKQSTPAFDWGVDNDYRTPCSICSTLLYSFEEHSHRFCCRLNPELVAKPPDLPPNWHEFLQQHPQIVKNARSFNHTCSPVAFATFQRTTNSQAEVQLHGRAYAKVIPLQARASTIQPTRCPKQVDCLNHKQ
eukprot:TRINITY_DN12676_c2_g1_i11.p2 TRINITY_DN12676_c2_g1~~TRINITY_DN12676_c2_g1_i11.p2  ORF type:complete len:151 (+),score=25.93 TRINITY_DN12676_c2_g1_i11:910-1362(+)